MMRNSGWKLPEDEVEFSWEDLVGRVQMHIKKLNFGYKMELSKEGVTYYNALGKIVGPNKIELTTKDGKK